MSTARPLIGLFITHANELIGDDQSRLTAVARALDDAGVGYLTVADHLALAPDLSAHDALGGGTLGYPMEEPYPEPLTTLAAIAAVTTRIRLMTGILVAPLRAPLLLAKTASTVAVLAGGRLDLGVGSGWHEAEFAALGVPIDEKVTRLDEGLAACRELWRGGPSSYHGSTVTFDNLYLSPLPPGGDVPVWFAGRATPATLRRVVRTGAGWIPISALSVDDAREARAHLTRICEEAGRDPATVGIRSPLAVQTTDSGDIDWSAIHDHVSALYEAGVDGVHAPLRLLAHSFDELEAVLPQVVQLGQF